MVLCTIGQQSKNAERNGILYLFMKAVRVPQFKTISKLSPLTKILTHYRFNLDNYATFGAQKRKLTKTTNNESTRISG